MVYDVGKGIKIRVIEIDSNTEEHIFIDGIGNFFYYEEYTELGEYSGHSTNYIKVGVNTMYFPYSFFGTINRLEMVEADDAPSDPNLTELDL